MIKDFFLYLIKNYEIKEDKYENDFYNLLAIFIKQNTKDANVIKCFNNLKNANINDINSLLLCDDLGQLIKASGFYNTKAKRIKDLCTAIKNDFDSLENFKENVSYEWLIKQKGISNESACMILNIFCNKAYLIVDTAILKILKELNYEFENYEDAQNYISNHINNDELYKALNSDDLAYLYLSFYKYMSYFYKNFFSSKQNIIKAKEILKNYEY
ncbi:endonuclease III [Campylobacter canadensis]|uniref:Endonuclease III n=1 Tax=Campylobacter canadensis TaxID=449520 RepID=A0ABS7WQT1_9BACT|nr:endonuclease III [Campylobacter canadensis]MBZ7987116.1 endonuclease III [Campylobacter canadensis]MBZ7998152.1 endonuclease III [Campylobacter canadensis]